MAKKISYADVVRGPTKDFDQVGKVSSASVEKHTGKGWKAWIDLLTKDGAAAMTHSELAAFLKKKYRLTPWWQQGVALGFQIGTGRRRVGQDAKGKYMVTATKSLPVTVSAVWKAVLSPQGMALWLRPMSPLYLKPKTAFETQDGYFGEIRTLAARRRIRLTWQDPLWEKPSTVEVLLVARPGKKAILVFNHTGIPDDKTRTVLKTRWRQAADGLAQELDPHESTSSKGPR